jgi:predicted GIY-YIG superfamily endonuclease
MPEISSSDVTPVTIKAKWLTGKWCPLCRTIENLPGKRWSDICRPDGSGVYRLIALDASMPGIVPASLDRVCGIDSTGTLYIGVTKSLRRRLASLVSRNRTNDPLSGSGHQFMNAKLARRFAPRLRAISWQKLDSAEAAHRREAELLRAYKARFGELPPMNGQSSV